MTSPVFNGNTMTVTAEDGVVFVATLLDDGFTATATSPDGVLLAECGNHDHEYRGEAIACVNRASQEDAAR